MYLSDALGADRPRTAVRRHLGDATRLRADAALHRAKTKGRDRYELAADKDERMGSSVILETVSQHMH